MGDLVNLVTVFKQPTGGFVPTIMEFQTVGPDAQRNQIARPAPAQSDAGRAFGTS